jgi:hypothetical protein
MNSKTVGLFLAVSLAATLAACGGDKQGSEGGEAEDTAPKTEQTQPSDNQQLQKSDGDGEDKGAGKEKDKKDDKDNGDDEGGEGGEG